MYISYGLAVGLIVAFGVILWLLTRWSLDNVARSLANPGYLQRGMLHRTAFASTIATVNTRMATPSQVHRQIFCSIGILTGSPSLFRIQSSETSRFQWRGLWIFDNAADRPFNPSVEKSCCKSVFFRTVFIAPQMSQNTSEGMLPKDPALPRVYSL